MRVTVAMAVLVWAVNVNALTVSTTIQRQKEFGMAGIDALMNLVQQVKSLVGQDENSDFKEQMAQSESSGRTDVVNPEGFMGAYQFGEDRLSDFKKDTGMDFSKEQFLKDKDLQDQVFDWHVNDINSYIDSRNLDKYIGTELDGITITREGLVAGAHLGGRTGLRKYLETDGKYNPEDSNGTSISDYVKKFST